MITDADVRRQALDPQQSFLVEAPAGSGKTELLIQRYLRLLSIVDQPEFIVALTFTRKAAAEMKERVLNALRDAAENAPLESDYAAATRQLAQAALARSEEQEWSIITDSRRLQIGTIDSFCSLLTRQMPLLSEFGSHPEIVEFAAELYHLAARRTLVTLAESDTLAHIFHDAAMHFDGDLSRLETLIANLLAKRDQWKRRIDFDRLHVLREDIDQILQEEMVGRLESAANLWPPDLSNACPEIFLEALPEWRSLADLMLTKEGDARKRKPFTETLQRHPDFCKALHGCRQQIPPLVSDEQWQLIWNFSALLSVALLQLDQVFREHRQVDFTQIAQAAVAALGTPESPTELAFRLDFRINHLLVDEFQDTSLVQYELLERLSAQWSAGDNRTLFVVGDPMQSIYRFRNAEVGLFLKAAQEGIGNVHLERLTLTRNFRSQPEIVHWVNATFGRIASADDNAREGKVKVRPAEPARTDSGPVPRLHPFVNDNGEAEASRVTELARAALAEPNNTTAILVRTRRQLAFILPALRRTGIPYEAVELDALTEEQHILDLLSLSKAIHHLADRTSWLACLRAPFCGLTLADLSALAEDEPKRPVFDLLCEDERLKRLSPEGRRRVYRFRDVLEKALNSFGHYPVRWLVESAWLALGGSAALTEENHRGDAESFFALLEQNDTGGFIPDFSLLETRLHHLFAKPKKHDGPFVQVMTIHKSKGLEFDTVIIPQLGGTSRAPERDLLIWESSLSSGSNDRFILAALPQSNAPGSPDKVYYDFVRGFAARKDEAEQQRLLYVAVTRARRSLHLLGNVRCRKSGDDVCQPANGFLRLLWDGSVQDQFRAELRRQAEAEPAPPEMLIVQGIPTGKLRRLPTEWSLPWPEPAVPWQPSYRLGQVMEEHGVNQTDRHVGIIVRGLLRQIPEDGLKGWNNSRVKKLASFVQEELGRAGIPKEQQAEAVDQILNALSQTLRSKRGRWILSLYPDAQSVSEWTGLLDQTLETVPADRTFTDEQGVQWIIQYNMAADRQGLSQSPSQLDQLVRLLPQTGKPMAVGIYFPLLDEWLAREMVATEPVGAHR